MDDPELDRRPADPPGVEAAALPGVQRPDQLDRQLRIRREPDRRRDDEGDDLGGRGLVVGALPGVPDERRADLSRAVGGEDGRDRLDKPRQVGAREAGSAAPSSELLPRDRQSSEEFGDGAAAPQGPHGPEWRS